MTMARIVGAEQAIRCRCPLVPAILHWATQKTRLRLSRRALDVLTRELELRRSLAPILKLKDIKPRSKVERDVFKHVRVGLKYMDNLETQSFLLADEVGVGKTPLPILHAPQHTSGPHLVITTNSAKFQWERAIRRWAPQNHSHVTQGTVIEQSKTIRRAANYRWIIVHWESLVHCRDVLTSIKWGSITADEVQFAANRKTQRTETLHDLEAEWKYALTAHPYSKSPEQLFAILKFLRPDVYTSFWRYFWMHVRATPKPFGGYDVQGASRPGLLRWELQPLMLRRTRQQVRSSLPAISRVPRYVTLSKTARREYDKLRKQFFVELEGRSTALPIPSVLARTTRLRQYLVDPGLLGSSVPSAKYPEVARLLREFEYPTVIFTSFLQAAERLKKYLKPLKFNAMVLGGTTKKSSEREAMKRAFLRGRLDALIVVTQLGSTALNLGKYGLVMHLDLPWTPKDLEQSEGRVDRPNEDTGESVPTTAYRIITEDSYEQRMEAKLENRNWDFKKVFSPRELKELFE
jgi:SNF2 family DNA or RNA helicase